MKLTARLADFSSINLTIRYLREAAQVGLKLGASEAEFIIRTEAETLCPVDTGRLRSSIHAEHVQDDPDVQIWAVLPAYPSGNKYGFEPPYARRIELGFTGRDSLGRFYNQAPQPYMRPAADNKGAEAVGAIRRSILDELAAANAKVAVKAAKR